MIDMAAHSSLPTIALTLGDPAGIGPELIARLLAKPEATQHANLVLVGDAWLWQQGQAIAGVQIETEAISDWSELRQRRTTQRAAFLAVDTIAPGEVTLGKPAAAGGKAVLQVLNACMDAALAGAIDGICFAPLNKQAMKMGGLAHEDELHHFARYLGVQHYFCEFNIMAGLWTSRISSHIPLKDVPRYVTQERITQAAELIYQTLLCAGVSHPKIAIAGLNPHNGEGGTCGREEIDTIIPAVQALQARTWPTEDPFHGPFSADTIFLKAQTGQLQAIVTMYHDQGQIALKLLGFSQGVTVQGGLPIPITTPAHGTAYDIAGLGRAHVQATWQALQVAARMGTAKRHTHSLHTTTCNANIPSAQRINPVSIRG